VIPVSASCSVLCAMHTHLRTPIKSGAQHRHGPNLFFFRVCAHRIAGLGGVYGGGMAGMGLMGCGFPGLMPMPGMPGMLAPGMPGSLACAGVGSFPGRGKGGSGGKKQRENLPKQSVTTLKIWLYDHIHHPYPTETEKNTLMQVSSF